MRSFMNAEFSSLQERRKASSGKVVRRPSLANDWTYLPQVQQASQESRESKLHVAPMQFHNVSPSV